MNYEQMTATAGDPQDSTLMKLAKGLVKPVLVGLAAWGIGHYVNGGLRGLPFFGYTVSAATVVGVSVFAGNIVANNVSEWVIGSLNQYRALGDFEKALVNPLLTGVVAIAAMMVGGVNYFRGWQAYAGIIATGAVSEAVGDYAYRNYVANWVM